MATAPTAATYCGDLRAAFEASAMFRNIDMLNGAMAHTVNDPAWSTVPDGRA